MSIIRVLPDILINQIAAGEVVERPASVVKELLENALDAGASRISIAVENGGRRLIRITDDGCGMSRDDALLAFERHATSKLKTAEDLAAIATLGFRGEALPSIAAVAKVTLQTRSADSFEGTRIEISGGRIFAVKDVAWAGGSELSVADLFFNMPARRKFLRGEATELYHISNLVTHYALANTGLAFSLSHNGRELINVTPATNRRDRAYQLFGGEFLASVVELDGNVPEAQVKGFISNPGRARTTRESQYFFVNGRFVRDKVISRAVANAFRNVLPSGMYPSAIIFLEVPLADVDVNAHPAKTEVRFRKANLVQDAIFEAIRATITEHKPVPDFPALIHQTRSAPFAGVGSSIRGYDSASIDQTGTDSNDPPGQINPASKNFPDRDLIVETDAANQRIDTMRLAEFERHVLLETGKGERIEASEPSSTTSFTVPATIGNDVPGQTASTPPNATESGSASEEIDQCGSASLLGLTEAHASGTFEPHSIRPIGQLRESFIIATDQHGLLLIDQHVAHERILFEQHLDRYRAQRIEVQKLLLPETIDLTPAQAGAFNQIETELEANGFEVMRLSGRTIAVQAMPAGISMSDARTLLIDLLDTIERERGGLTLDELRGRIAASVACKAAIKVNMSLTHEKMIWLIDKLMLTEVPTNCPHGRPIMLRFSMREILRGFERI